MNFLALIPKKKTALASPTDIKELIKNKSTTLEIIPFVQIISGQSKALTDPNFKDLKLTLGDLFVASENLNLGNRVQVVIGPWRVKGMSIENGNVTACDYNLTPKSRYIPEKNDWEFPDGITPTMQQIGQGKSNGSTVLHNVGQEVLFYLPEHGIGVTLWFTNTMLTMTKCLQDCIKNPGKVAYLRTEKAPSKRYTWFLPHINIDAKQPDQIDFSQDFMRSVDLFLNPGVVHDPENAQEKPR